MKRFERSVLLAGLLLTGCGVGEQDKLLDGFKMGDVNFGLDFMSAVRAATTIAQSEEGRVRAFDSSPHPEMRTNSTTIISAGDRGGEDYWEIMGDGQRVTRLARSQLYPKESDHTKYPEVEATISLLVQNLGKPTIDELVGADSAEPGRVITWFADEDGQLVPPGEQAGLCDGYAAISDGGFDRERIEGLDLSGCGAVVMFEYQILGDDARFYNDYSYSALDVRAQLEYILPALDEADRLKREESQKGLTPAF